MRTGRTAAAGIGGALLALLAASGPAGAQGLRALSFTVDNDGLRMWMPSARPTDWYYTHGTRVEAVLGWVPPGLPGRAEEDRPCPAGPASDPCIVTRLGLTQEIYTPRVHAADPVPGDRPYSGWLAGTVAVERITPGRTTVLTLELGVTGRPSLGREAHLAFHRVLGVPEPLGWEHQIPFEVAWAVGYRDTRRWPMGGGSAGGSGGVALEPWWGLSAGTLRTAGSAGLSLRAGWNAPAGVTWRGGDGHPYVAARLGVEGEVVVRDLFLDGSLWHDSARATREPWIGRLRSEIVAGWGDLGVVLALTRATRDFRGQDAGHGFGTVGVAWRGW